MKDKQVEGLPLQGRNLGESLMDVSTELDLLGLVKRRTRRLEPIDLQFATGPLGVAGPFQIDR